MATSTAFPSVELVQYSTFLLALASYAVLLGNALGVQTGLPQLILGTKDVSAVAEHVLLVASAILGTARVVAALRPYDKCAAGVNVMLSIAATFAASVLFAFNTAPCIGNSINKNGLVAAVTSMCCMKKLVFFAHYFVYTYIAMSWWHARVEGTIRASESPAGSAARKSESPAKPAPKRSRSKKK
jgi:hypothetical protein